MTQISLRVDDDVKRGAVQPFDDTSAVLFYSESNMAHLRRGAVALNEGKGRGWGFSHSMYKKTGNQIIYDILITYI